MTALLTPEVTYPSKPVWKSYKLERVFRKAMKPFDRLKEVLEKIEGMEYNKSTKKTKTKSLKKLIKNANQTMQSIQAVGDVIELEIAKVTEKITDWAIFSEQGQPDLTEKAGLEKGLEINDLNQSSKGKATTKGARKKPAGEARS